MFRKLALTLKRLMRWKRSLLLLIFLLFSLFYLKHLFSTDNVTWKSLSKHDLAKQDDVTADKEKWRTVSRDELGGSTTAGSKKVKVDRSKTDVNGDQLSSVDHSISIDTIRGVGEQGGENPSGRMSLERNSEMKENETEEEFMSRMEDRMKHRRALLRDKCNELGLNPGNEELILWRWPHPRPRPWTFFSENYRLMYCEIPKSGCTNWKKIILVLNGVINNTDDITQAKVHVAKLDTVGFRPPPWKQKIYENSTKLLVVREPFERMVSAYMDKVLPKPPRGQAIFPKFSAEVAKTYSKRWKDPTIYGNQLRMVTVCEHREAVLQCPRSHQAIYVINASFGRMDGSTCLTKNATSKWRGIPCMSQSAFMITSALCNGKQKCDVVASEYQFGALRECVGVTKYLSLIYKCVSTEHLDNATVCQPRTLTLQCPPGGALSIGKAFYGRTNNVTCPYPGRMLNLKCDEPTATQAVSGACNGKESCTIEATPYWIQSSSCPSTRKYLQVWYSCTGSLDVKPAVVKMSMVSERVYREAANHSRNIRSLEVGEMERGTNERSEQGLPPRRSQTKPPKPPDAPGRVYKNPSYLHRYFDVQATPDDFASYLADPANADVVNDVMDHGSPTMKMTSVRHWQNYHSLCLPCHIHYDVIAHMETIEEDARYLLKRIGAPPDLKFPKGYDQTGQSSTSQDAVDSYFSQLSEEKIKKLYQVYKADYELFGYPAPSYVKASAEGT
ncbi:uncharacterized protein LOC143470401 [Clavelina lepadiformis]|uniref:uncharacterized protein LOC143470401 n=1 Tax=Clavelina lepadiformis TaxID=159417 RepID=UPI0040416A3B